MRELLTIDEASDYTGLSHEALMLCFFRGQCVTENVGGTLLFRLDSLTPRPPAQPICLTCGFIAKSETGLATHRRRKHGG